MRNHRLAFGLIFGLTVVTALSCALLTPPRGPLKFEPLLLPDAQVGVSYDTKISIAGNATPAGEFSILEGALPEGLALEKVEGENAARISGVPEQPGMFTFKVFVWCYGTNVSGQVGEQEYTLLVK